MHMYTRMRLRLERPCKGVSRTVCVEGKTSFSLRSCGRCKENSQLTATLMGVIKQNHSSMHCPADSKQGQ